VDNGQPDPGRLSYTNAYAGREQEKKRLLSTSGKIQKPLFPDPSTPSPHNLMEIYLAFLL
jgi:hypothetical protein